MATRVHVRIRFRKVSNERYELTLVRANGEHESVVCETRSTLLHDFLHFALEAEAHRDGGFWGVLASGKTLHEMNDRDAIASTDGTAPELAEIERVVGALHGATHGRSAADLATGLRRYADGRGERVPAWVNDDVIVRTVERLRRVRGQWNATPFGDAMELEWPPSLANTLGHLV